MKKKDFILSEDNLLDTVKSEYQKILANIDDVLSKLDDIVLEGGKFQNYFDGLEKFLGKNNFSIKLKIEKSIQKIIRNKHKLEVFDIKNLSHDLPGDIFKEQILNLVDLISYSYEYLNILGEDFDNMFSLMDSKDSKIQEYKDIYLETKQKIQEDCDFFEIIKSKYKNFVIAKGLMKKLKSGFYGFWVKNYRMSFLIMLVIILAGIASLIKVPKESSPDIKFGIIAVSTIYDGASPEDIDNLITEKLENEIENIDGISQISSTSRLGMSAITIELENGTDIRAALQDIKDKADAVSLPTDAEDPNVMEVSTNNELMFSYLLYGKKDEFSNEYLQEKARVIKDKLEGKNGIVSIDIGATASSDVSVSGGGSSDSQFEVEVLINKSKLENIGMTVSQVSQIIRSFNKNQPLGSYRIGRLKYDYRIQGEFDNIQDLENVPLKDTGGSVIRLKDIAQIKKVLIDESYRNIGFLNDSGYNYVSLNFNKKAGTSIFTNSDNAKKAIQDLMDGQEFKGLKGTYTTDLSDMLKEDYNNLSNNGLQTLILVFVTLLFFVGLKEAVIASVILPLSFLCTFIVLDYSGLTLNFLTNFSLILTLGIAIDTIVVVVEGAGEKMKLGYNPMSAVLLSIKEYKYSLMSGTATTVFAFLPIMFLPGIMGKFLAYIPITIFSTLIAGLFLSLTLLSAVFFKLNKPKKEYKKEAHIEEYMGAEEKALLEFERQGKKIKTGEKLITTNKIIGIIVVIASVIYFYISVFHTFFTFLVGALLIWMYIYRDGFFKRLENSYKSHLEIIVKTRLGRIITILVPFVLMILTFVFFGGELVGKFSLFPPSDADYLNIKVSSSNGVDKDFLKGYLTGIEEQLAQIPELDNYNLSLSSSSISAEVNFIKKNKRKEKGLRNIFEIEKDLNQKLGYLENEGLKLAVEIPAGGPPSGDPVGVKLIADNNKKFKQLIQVSKDFEKYLLGVDGTKNITNSSEDTPGQFVFSLDKDKLRSMGLTPGDIMGDIYFSMNGLKAGTLKAQYDDEDIVLKMDDFDKNLSPDQVMNIMINTPTGQMKLSSVANYSFDNAVSMINREDGKITVKVGASTELGAPTLDIQNGLIEFAQNYQYPEGISYESGGENSENQDLLIATGVSFIIAIILIFTVLVLQFRSYSQPLIILYSVVMALLGVNIGLYLTGNAYSMSFGIGFIALTGIVVNDAILLIETINENIKRGLKSKLAILEAGRSRLQPIMVTTLTTCFGLLPIAMQDEFWAGLGYTVVFGLAMGSLMTLYIIPTLYFELFLRDKKGGIISKIKGLFKKKNLAK